jgi:hypothetical protein
MRRDGAKSQHTGGQIGPRHAEYDYELMSAHIDFDLRAAALFAQVALALSLLGLILSVMLLRAIPLTLQGLDLLTAGS